MSATRMNYLFYRYLDGTATEEETNELMEVLAHSGNEGELMTLLDESWGTFHSDRKRIEDIKSLEMLKAALSSRDGEAAIRRRAKIFTWPRVAAAAIIILAGAGLYHWNGAKPVLEDHKAPILAVQTSRLPVSAYTRQYRLPDGSMVILHANSHLDQPVDFSGGTREVSLSGEAYFDIAHDPVRPFIIHTGNVKTTVLGTAFNIKTYPDGLRVVISVTKGKVKVENGNKLLAVLEPDQQVIYTIPADRVEEKEVDAEAIVTGWTREDMAFDGSSFAEVTDVLSRRYGTVITFRNPKLRNCKIKAYFNGTEPLGKVLELLCTISNAHYTTGSDGKIVLDGAGCE